MPRNPNCYHTMADTGEVVFDSSLPNSYILGKCPTCSRMHMGSFEQCDECVSYDIEKQREAYEQELQDMQDSEHLAELEWQRHLDECYKDGETPKNIFDGTPDWLRME